MIVDLHGSKIRVLPPDVVRRIAAGEIIERPAAVVKELVENSLDAGSTSVMVEVVDGGRTLIKVIDDGEGMSPADVPLAFERHATSKLQHERDLESIGTFGFRGEALASIAAVSRVRLVTARRGEPVGTAYEVTGGVQTGCEEVAAPPGTQLEIADLFYNTPARKKFLKTTTTEFSHICQVVQQASLAWVEVHFRLRHNGQSVLDYPPVKTQRDRLLQVYGQRVVGQMVPVHADGSGLRVHGMVLQAVHARGGRSPQELFINRRPVRNATVSHAVYESYGAAIPKGTHPLFVLFLDVDAGCVDVNVHPTKREVRFADAEAIHHTIRRAVRAAIGTAPTIADGVGPMTVATVTMSTLARDSSPMVAPVVGAQGQAGSAVPSETAGLSVQAPVGPHGVQETLPAYVIHSPVTVLPLGQVAATFLVAQVGAELQVVDQHTAHERVLFERLRRAASLGPAPSQGLLIPHSLDVPPHAAAMLEEALPDLARLGFEVEPFGSGRFLVRAIPAMLAGTDAGPLLGSMLEDLVDVRSTASLDQRLHPILASLACHTAVRSGRPMTIPEMKTLIEDWVAEGSPTTCPHGRRTVLRLPFDELNRLFGR